MAGMKDETVFSLILGPERLRDLRGNFPLRLRRAIREIDADQRRSPLLMGKGNNVNNLVESIWIMKN